jgi:hypothetical protein
LEVKVGRREAVGAERVVRWDAKRQSRARDDDVNAGHHATARTYFVVKYLDRALRKRGNGGW